MFICGFSGSAHVHVSAAFHEYHTEIRIRCRWRGYYCSEHIAMSPWFKEQGGPQIVQVVCHVFLFSDMVLPGTFGMPPITTLVGSPMVWESTAIIERTDFIIKPTYCYSTAIVL